jgi:methionine-rich copper-binding protein CopC
MRVAASCVPFALTAALVLVLAASPAEAHAHLVRTVPSADSVLPTTPAEIRLVFDEAVQPALSGISIAGGAGGGEWTAPANAVAGDPTQLVVPLPEFPTRGVFRVRWHVVSADMHKVEGEFVFQVVP